MIKRIKNATRGFTLIELLVVIAIIGLLASIVLVSLSSARRKARDSRRIGDLRQVQLALELYSDATPAQIYPFHGAPAIGTVANIANSDANLTTELAAALVPTYLGGMPADPTGSGDYELGYIAGTASSPITNCVTGGTAPCSHYILRASLEEATNPALGNDNDSTTG